MEKDECWKDNGNKTEAKTPDEDFGAGSSSNVYERRKLEERRGQLGGLTEDGIDQDKEAVENAFVEY